MTFSNILNKLKQYSFDNKMALCCKLSLNEYEKYKSKRFDEVKIYPHEMEVFALLSIMSYPENGNGYFNDSDIKDFWDIINFIKKFIPPAYNVNPKNLKYYLSNLQINQFSIQQDYLIDFYRYNFFFNFKNDRIDMNKIFYNKFNIQYDNILVLGAFLCVGSISITKDLSNELFAKIVKLFPEAFKLISIDRKDFVKKQNYLLNNKIENCLFGYKLFFQYPFICCDNEFYFPIPYAIKDACTSSFLYRLTEGDNELRALIGKEVLERYIYHIHSVINTYDEIQGEFIYHIGKIENRSPDLMLRKSNKALLVDIKASVPSIRFRELNPDYETEAINKMVKHVIQIYKNIEKFNTRKFSFDSNSIIQLENTYGLIIVLEDNYLNREKIALQACERLCLNKNDPLFNYVHSNIKIFGLNEVEMLALDSTNIIDVLEAIRDSPDMWYNSVIRGMDFKWAKKTSKDYIKFKSYLLDNVMSVTNKIDKVH